MGAEVRDRFRATRGAGWRGSQFRRGQLRCTLRSLVDYGRLGEPLESHRQESARVVDAIGPGPSGDPHVVVESLQDLRGCPGVEIQSGAGERIADAAGVRGAEPDASSDDLRSESLDGQGPGCTGRERPCFGSIVARRPRAVAW